MPARAHPLMGRGPWGVTLHTARHPSGPSACVADTGLPAMGWSGYTEVGEARIPVDRVAQLGNRLTVNLAHPGFADPKQGADLM